MCYTGDNGLAINMNGVKKSKKKLAGFLRYLEKYTKTDMIYAARGGFWILVGKGILMLISLATLTAFARWVPPEVYGQYQFVLATAGVFVVLSLPGLKSALTRSVARGYEGSLPEVFKTKMRWSLLAGVGLLLVAGWFLYQEDLMLAGSFVVAGLFTPLKFSANVFGSFWQGKKRFDVKVKYRVLSELAVAAAVITVLFFTDHLIIIVATLFAASALGYGVSYLLTVWQVVDQEPEEGVVSYGKHLSVMGALGTVSKHLDKLLLWMFLGPVELAVYMLAFKPIEKIKGAAPIGSLTLPKLSEHGVKGVRRKKSIFRKFLVLMSLSVPAAVLLVLAAPYIYQVLFPEYQESVIYFQFLCLIPALLPFAVLSSSLVAEKKVGSMYVTKTVTPLLKIVLFIILIPIYGIGGVVASLVITRIIGGGLTLYFFWRM